MHDVRKHGTVTKASQQAMGEFSMSLARILAYCNLVGKFDTADWTSVPHGDIESYTSHIQLAEKESNMPAYQRPVRLCNRKLSRSRPESIP